MDQAHPFYQKLQNSNNILLVKDDVGKPKKCVRNLPNGDFSYGSKPKKDSEGAGAILSSWQIHKPTSDEEAEKDFKRLNKMSLNNKLITPKQVSEFVKQTDVRVKDKRNKQEKNKPILANEEYFGVPNRPGTPMDLVVSNGYGNYAADEKKKAYEVSMQIKSVKQKTGSQATEKSTVTEEKKEFKMKKFQQVESKVKNSLKK